MLVNKLDINHNNSAYLCTNFCHRSISNDKFHLNASPPPLYFLLLIVSRKNPKWRVVRRALARCQHSFPVPNDPQASLEFWHIRPTKKKKEFSDPRQQLDNCHAHERINPTIFGHLKNRLFSLAIFCWLFCFTSLVSFASFSTEDEPKFQCNFLSANIPKSF